MFHHVKLIIISFLQFERQSIDFTEPRFNKSCCWILFQHLQMQILIYHILIDSYLNIVTFRQYPKFRNSVSIGLSDLVWGAKGSQWI